MISNEKLRPYIIFFLIFCVSSSKNIIIYNEETLVALSFLAFIVFVFHYYGNTIKESLNERSQAILIELQNFLNLKQQALEQLYKEHEKVSQLNKGVIDLANFTNSQIIIASQRGQQALNRVFSQQITEKLKTLSFSNRNLEQKFQQFMADNILAYVLYNFQRERKKKKYKTLNRKQISSALGFLQKKI